MTKQDWDLDTEAEEIVSHLQDEHAFPFNDRRSLSAQDFIFEHFPAMIKNMEDKEYGYLSEEGKDDFNKIRKMLKKALKICEERSIPIANVLEFNEKNEGEWRICKPTMEQLNYLKFARWFTSAEGYFNKAVMQGSMIEDIDVDMMLEDLKITIEQRQKKRKKKRDEAESV